MQKKKEKEVNMEELEEKAKEKLVKTITEAIEFDIVNGL